MERKCEITTHKHHEYNTTKSEKHECIFFRMQANSEWTLAPLKSHHKAATIADFTENPHDEYTQH